MKPKTLNCTIFARPLINSMAMQHKNVPLYCTAIRLLWSMLVFLLAGTQLAAQAPDTLQVEMVRLNKMDTISVVKNPSLTVEVVRLNKMDTIYAQLLNNDWVLLELVHLNKVDTVYGRIIHQANRPIKEGQVIVGTLAGDKPIRVEVVQLNQLDTIRASSGIVERKLETVQLNRLDTITARYAVKDTLLVEVVRVQSLDTVRATWINQPIIQTNQPPAFNRNRVIAATAIHAGLYGGGLLLLSQAWYNNYKKAPLHSFNDSKEWLQMDKVGHAWTAYQLARCSHAAWKWAGLSEKQQIWLGGLGGFGFQTAIELLDGSSAEWGWSWADVASNAVGSSLFIAQQLAWKEQRIAFKFAFHKKNYDEPYLNQRSDALFGKSLAERGLKDYNGQGYWFSANISSFFPETRLPRWLNLAVGYGVDGLFGGYTNQWIDPTTGASVNAFQRQRIRQWYLAPDVDFTRIRTNNKWLKSLFFVLSGIKVPAPALRYSNGKLALHGFYL